jgi:parvulin-like peptidyl-prolyl isomerase
MNRTVLVLAVAVSLALSMPADAQKRPGARSATTAKKLYRWVDAEGKEHVSDTLPPEMVGQERQEISAASGRTTATVARELTPEEKAAYAAEQERTQVEAARLAQQQRDEEAMLASYLTEDDLKRAYDERIGLLKQTLESTDVSLNELRKGLAVQLADASETELQNKTVGDVRVKKIRELHVDLVRLRQFQANRHVELLALDAEYVRMLERYRVRRAEESAPAPAAPGQPQ